MRVRISYSVDLKDVPLECARMLHDAASQMEEVKKEVGDIVRQLDDGKAQLWIVKDNIDRCRRKLAKLDAVLEDNDMILQGYFETKESHEEKSDVSEG